MKKNLVIALGVLVIAIGAGGFFVQKKEQSIVLITIDTLRADHMSCYGYPRTTTPNIDRIARQGVVFTRATATAPWTAPSMASIMTGLYPVSHGVKNGLFKYGKVYNQEILHERYSTLAEVLRAGGYTTFGAVANIHMTKDLGFAQGFDFYYCTGFDDAAKLNRVVMSWKNKLKNCRKFFLWVHYFDPHDPYNSRKPWIDDYTRGLSTPGRDLSSQYVENLLKIVPDLQENKNDMDYLVGLYDSEINFVDYHIGRLIQALDLDADTMMVISSDHGEEFLDHGLFGHGHTLYHELLHVPLILKYPHSSRYAGKSVDQLVSIMDIMPTIMHFAQTPPVDGMQGKNLFNIPQDAPENVARDYLLSEHFVLKALYDTRWKYIYHFCENEGQLYDVGEDPGELDNRLQQQPEKAASLQENLFTWFARSPKATSITKTVTFSQDIEDQLKALGYIVDDGTTKRYKKSATCGTRECHQYFEERYTPKP